MIFEVSTPFSCACWHRLLRTRETLLGFLVFKVYKYFFRSSDDEKTDSEKTFTVIFHAMLSNKFKWDDYTQVEIRGSEPVFNGWKNTGLLVTSEG